MVLSPSCWAVTWLLAQVEESVKKREVQLEGENEISKVMIHIRLLVGPRAW